jgi:hypothetical protein
MIIKAFLSLFLFIIPIQILSAQEVPIGSGLEELNFEEVHLVIEELTAAETDFGLSEQRIRLNVYRALREAGLRPSSEFENEGFMSIQVQIFKPTYLVEVKYHRMFEYFVGEELFSIWLEPYSKSVRGLIKEGEGVDLIYDQADLLIYEFIGEYVNANLKYLNPQGHEYY